MDGINCKFWSQWGTAAGKCSFLDKTVSNGFCQLCHRDGRGCELRDAAQPIIVQISLPAPPAVVVARTALPRPPARRCGSCGAKAAARNVRRAIGR